MLNRTPTFVLLSAAVFVAVVSCDDNGVVPMQADFQQIIDDFGLTPLPPVEHPQYNPYNEDRIALGQLIFFDPILGGESATWVKVDAGQSPNYRTNDAACGSCHLPGTAFADGRKLGAGVGTAGADGMATGPARSASGLSLVTGLEVGTEPRNSQSILNAVFNGKGSPRPEAESFQFMDGRVTQGLEAQALEPIVNREEMAGDAYGRDVLGDALTADAIRDSITARIRDIPGYVDRFKLAFPGEITGAADITMSHITKAIAAFERELVTPGSRYDQFVAGDFDVFSEQEKQGFELFFGKALCGDCHTGPMLSDFSFHVQGAGDAYEPGFPGKDGQGRDLGRFHADPVEFADQKFAFRTLTIRNVGLTAPYFHSGSAATLTEAVEFYNRGGQGAEDISDTELAAEGAVRDPSIRPLDLTGAEMEALVTFMKTTTAPVQAGPAGLDLTAVPRIVPSGLTPPGVPRLDLPDPSSRVH